MLARLLLLFVSFSAHAEFIQTGFPRTISKQENECLVKNTYFEANAEAEEGKIAVIYVVLNRSMSDRNYSKTTNICSIVHKPYAFSWYNNGDKSIPKEAEKSKQEIQRIVDRVLSTYSKTNDITSSSTHYINSNLLQQIPSWVAKLQHTITIGGHTFYKYSDETINYF